MKHLLSLGLLFVWASAVQAQGEAHLTWDDCWVGAGRESRTFSCDTNGGTDELVVAFVLYEATDDFVGTEIVLDMESETPTLPDWWQLWNQGACREAGLSISTDFSNPPHEAGFCTTAWQDVPLGGIGAYQTALYPPPPPLNVPAPNRARLKLAYTTAGAWPLAANVNYSLARIIFSHAKTVGDSTCGGCATPMCMGAVVKLTGFSWRLWLSSDCVAWQGGSQCCFAILEPNRTWKQIRALQR
jgi:hypothetical protein